MALVATVTGKTVFGNKHIIFGTAAIASGDTRGSIACGSNVEFASVQGRSYAAGAHCIYTTNTIDATFTDPSATKALNWFAILRGN